MSNSPAQHPSAQPGDKQASSHSSTAVDFRARQARQVAADKKRSRQLDWEDTRRPAWVAWLAGVCLLAILVGILALSTSDRVAKPQNINGDQLGPFHQSVEEYDAHAADKLRSMTGDSPRWALVTPEQPASAAALADMTRDLDLRVSTLLLGPAQWPLPEPAVGQRRIDVYEAAIDGIAKGSGLPKQQIKVEGVVVYARPDVLRELDKRSGVKIVEPAHPEAVFGRIGIRPVSPSSPSSPAGR